jgi:xylulokinase
MPLEGTPVAVRPTGDTPAPATFVLAVDLGTGGPKAAVVAGDGTLVAHAFEKVGVNLTDDGGAEQDPAAWWAAVVAASRRALAESGVAPEAVVGMGCTAQWSGTVPVGPDAAPIGNAIIWMDSRGSRAVRQRLRGAVSVMGYDVTKVPRWIRLSAGVPSLSGKDPVGHILFLAAERPDVYRAAVVFLEPVDYLSLRLTGLARASFDSIAVHWVTDNRSINAVDYHPALLKMAGLERRLLPDLVPTNTVVGGLTAAAAAELGLVPGTAVVTGTGDLHSAAVGSGAVGDFAAHLYIGTSSWISGHVPFKKTAVATNIASIPAGVPGRYLIADEHETGGACLTWLLDDVLYPADGLGGERPEDAFGHLNDVAAAVPAGAGGVLFTPWLNGERSPVDDHTIRGGFHNLSLSSGRPEMVRAVFEGVAYNSAWLLGAVEKFCGRPLDTLAFVGGGANSAIWAQIHADVTGRRIRRVADPVLANVRGAALLTLLALGRIGLDDMGGLVAVAEEHVPDPATTAVYQEMAREFVGLYKATKGIHRRLNGRRLAAGGPGAGRPRS